VGSKELTEMTISITLAGTLNVIYILQDHCSLSSTE